MKKLQTTVNNRIHNLHIINRIPVNAVKRIVALKLGRASLPISEMDEDSLREVLQAMRGFSQALTHEEY